MAKKESLKDKLQKFANETFQFQKLEDIMGDRFGRYSKAIIQERAIPDIRDGLKPVQRRILFGMNQMKLTHSSPYKKCARVVGDVMGKYHPHGDSSIYEALVRMSQWWKMGVTLVDLQGNNGSIDGDGPAAHRYTECRLSKNADYLLQDIDKNTVAMIDNFDGEEKEPTVLPARFPNLLVNGGMGISSGYATYIPTHNINEVINATIYKIDHPNMTIDELLEIMPGPDFPTGGIVQGLDGIREAFITGAGTIVVKSRVSFEDISEDQKRIVITEIPYDTIKQKTVEKIEQIRIDKKVDGILEVRDETDRKGLRIAIDLKKGANKDAILAYLLKNTDLQVNLRYNMVAIHNMRPERVGVLEILQAYIDHQKDVITNRTNYLKAKDSHRLHIVDGLIKMVSIVDEVVHTIRKSDSKADAKENLIKKFDFSELQADAILAMQLYRLTNTDVTQLKAEQENLNKNIIEYDSILSSDKNLLQVIKKELKQISKEIVIPRKTTILENVESLQINESDLIAKEQVVVSVTKEGYIKRMTLKNVKASSINQTKDHDTILITKEVSTLDTLLGFTNLGNYVFIPVFKINECKMKDYGTYVNNLCQIDPMEKFVDILFVSEFDEKSQVLLASKEGQIKQILLSDLKVSRFSKSVRCMKLSQSDELVSADLIKDPREIIIATKNAEILRFRASEVSLYGTLAGGVKGITLKEGDELVSARYMCQVDDLILLTNRNTIKRIKVSDLTLSKRARAGIQKIKRVKSNPYEVIEMRKMTPNQYKENVEVNIIYTDGVDTLFSSDLKYNFPDGGKDIFKEGLGEIYSFTLNDPLELDKPISDDYLLDKDSNLELFDYDVIDDKPLKGKKSKVDDEFEEILARELKLKENKESLETKIVDDKEISSNSSSTIVRRKKSVAKIEADESKNDSKETFKFKKVKLFGDDD